MAHLKLNYDELASVLCLAFHLANADGSIDDIETAAILKALTDQYDFEGQGDLLKEYLDDAWDMDVKDALIHVAAFGPAEKQWASNFFVKTIVADRELDEDEKQLYWKIQDLCKLPDHNLD